MLRLRLPLLRVRRAVTAVAALGLCGGGVMVSDAGASAASSGSPFVVTAKISAGQVPFGVVLDPVTQKVFVSHVSSNTVSVIDAVTGKPDGVYQTGSSPGPLAVDSSLGELFVGGYDSVSEVNEASGQIIPLGVGVTPTAIAVDPNAHKVYAISDSRKGFFGPLIGSLSVIDETGADAGTATTVVADLGGYPFALAVDPSTHQVYVSTSNADDEVSVIDESGDADNGQLTYIEAGSVVSAMTLDPATHHLYLSNSVDDGTIGQLLVVDTSTDQVAGVVSLAGTNGPPQWMAADATTHDVYVGSSATDSLLVLDESGDINNGAVVGSFPLGGYPEGTGISTGIAVDPWTHNVYVANLAGGSVSVIGLNPTVGGTVSDASSGGGLAGACVRVLSAGTGTTIMLLHANSAGGYSGGVPPGAYKLLASDCAGGTHATTYYGGADNYDFDSPLAQAVTVTLGSPQTNLNVALPLAGTISGTVTDAASGVGIAGMCAYAIDTTANLMRGFSAPSSVSGRYSISGLPPGTDRIAFQPCTTGPYPLTYSIPVTVSAGGVTILNDTMSQT